MLFPFGRLKPVMTPGTWTRVLTSYDAPRVGYPGVIYMGVSLLMLLLTLHRLIVPLDMTVLADFGLLNCTVYFFVRVWFH